MRKEPANQGIIYSNIEKALLESCTLCPRECRVNRFKGGTGYCGQDAGLNIASVCIHRGEEPSISGPEGICNIFFAGCNMRCIYCQNHEISRPEHDFRASYVNLEDLLVNIEKILSTGVKAVGFVSPSHVVPQVRAVIRGLHQRGLRPVTVYNTNSYDKRSTIESLEGLIDVYLPDIKYVTPQIAGAYSDAYNYPEVALKALKEMYYQKGSILSVDNTGMAESGMVIRHLVLPGHVEESKKVLKTIAEELSTGVHLSLMSQYHPAHQVKAHRHLGRMLYKQEYDEVAETMEHLGFRNGWLQDMESYKNYVPDFSREHPFEEGT